MNLERAVEKVRRRHEVMAFTVVTQARLKERPQDPRRSQKKIMAAWEADERLKPLLPMIESWNRWREYYAHEDRIFFTRWAPKTASQLSACETLLDFAKDNSIDLDLLIACGHKSYERSKYDLSLNMLVAHGLDYFTRYAEAVQVDLDEDEYRASAASDTWDAELD